MRIAWLGRASRAILPLMLGLWLVAALPIHATPADYLTSRLDAYLQAEMRANRLPGLVVGIVQGNETLFLRGYGEAGPGQPMAPNTQLYIASVSKSFTALAIMQLAEESALDLDAPVQTYLPWFTLADPDAAAQITIRQLLHQTSGLGEEGYPGWDPGPDATLEESVRALHEARPIAAPGERYQYFNDNYNILGMVVQAVSGQPYETYLAEHVLDPLGMTRTVADPALAPNLAQGYGCVLGWPVPREEQFNRAHLPSGYLISTAEDLTNYLIAQLNDGRYGAAQVLSAEGMAAMHTSGIPEGGYPSSSALQGGYAMGWFVDELAGVPAILHGGDLSNFHADLALLPEQNLGIVLLTNENGLIPTLGVYPRLLRGIASIILGRAAVAGPGLVALGWILAVAIAVNIIGTLRRILGVHRWVNDAVERGTVRIVLGTGGPLLLSLLVLALPRFVAVATGRVPGWGLLFELAPDLIGWVWFGILTNAILVTLRLRELWNHRLTQTAAKPLSASR